LTDLQRQTLQAALDCLIPPDDFPGAWEAGVGNYLARQFEGDLASRRSFYLAGLDGIEAEAIARFGEYFSKLESEDQSSILQSLESGAVATSWAISPEIFFKLMVETAAEGYYSNPEQGGNLDAISWTMTGFSKYGPV
jgi:gluconate 2-dehydrogenase gamma chain